ncbi:MAG: M23 family metallopeptidase [Anaerolineales bacterium]
MPETPSPSLWKIVVSICIIVLISGGCYLCRWYRQKGYRTRRLITWLRQPEKHPEWAVSGGERCGPAPFLIPTEGYIGYVWGDSFRPGHTHQGIDIFTSGGNGTTPVFAAYAGYLTRLSDWKSSLIIRIPQDPLHPSRQIWTYYTHLADARGSSFIADSFPPGTSEVYVEEGTLLGYQGNYSGDPGNPVGVHLHFSIVKDNGHGEFLNELLIKNTLDPSPYFGLPLNASEIGDKIPVCDP